MRGSGLEDVLLESGLVAAMSLEEVMSGKHYERSLHCHKVMLECLERLLLEQFMLKKGDANWFTSLPIESLQKLDDLAQAGSAVNLSSVLEDDNVCGLINSYLEFRDGVRNGDLGKTAAFWMSYMDHISLVLSLLEAVLDNNFFLYAHSLKQVADVFFSYGGYNYAQYLSFFSLYLANIETSHSGATQLLQLGAIRVARSFIPGNRAAVDKTMEETFMRHAQSHTAGTGVRGLLTNYSA